MTDAELENLRTQVMQIQETLERQTKARRTIGLVSSVLAAFFAVAALGFIIAGAWLDPKSYPTTHQFVQIMGYVFLFTSLPLTLLAQALRAR